jgi:tRNA splicing endonuclease
MLYRQTEKTEPIAPVAAAMLEEDRISLVQKHFEAKGYRVHSGLQFGCELVLYADDPSRVHSDYCVSIVPEGWYLPMKVN